MNGKSERRSLWRQWPAFLIYLGIAVLATWPLAKHIATHIPDGTDTLSHYWNGWWAWQAIRAGQSPYRTPFLFYPNGLSVVYNNFAWLSILPWLALRPIVGGITAYNLTFLAHLGLCGFAAYLLVYDLTGNPRAAFVAGLIYLCWPYRMTQPSHPNLMSTWAIPLFLLFLGRAVRRGRWQDGLLSGLCLALVGYTRWQLLIPAVLMGAICVATAAAGRRRGLTPTRSAGLDPARSLGFGDSWGAPSGPIALRRRMLALALGGFVAVLALVPPVVLLAGEWRKSPATLVRESEESVMQTDALAYVTPPGVHSLLRPLTEPAYLRYYAGRGSRNRFSPYIGLTVLALGAIGLWRTRFRDTLPWIVMALLLVALALGPTLRINGRAYPALPMPYRLASRLFIVRLLRAPERFNMFLALPAAVLAGYGTAFLLWAIEGRKQGAGASRPSVVTPSVPKAKKRVAVVFACVLAALVYVEYMVTPLLLQPGQVSEVYAQLAAEEGEYAVLNVPVDPYRSKPYMYAQTVHSRPILQGHSSRYADGTFGYLDGQPWLREMRRYSDLPPKQTDVGRQLVALASDGIRYLVVHKELIGEQHWPNWERYLVVAPRYEDEDIAVYPTAPTAGRDFTPDPELLPGLGIVRTTLSAACVHPGHVMELDVAWGTTAPPGRDLSAELSLVSEEESARQTVRLPITEGWPASEWPADAVVWGRYVLAVPPDFPPGAALITLTLVDPQTGEVQGGPVPVHRVTVSPELCIFPVPADATAANALYGDAMRLMGYSIDQDEEALILTLHWRSERRMDRDYKVFVHVFDPATGIPVAQDDAMPLHWTYPTSYWEPGESVMDVIRVPLEDVPAGTYGLAVGVYDPETTERLPVVDQMGRPHADGRLILRGEAVEVDNRVP
jgi:hypothetical protein